MRAAIINSSSAARISGIDSQMKATKRQRAVDPRVLPHGGEHAERNRERPRDERGRTGQHQRVGEAVAQHVEHRLVARKRLPEVEMEDDVPEIDRVLDVPRLVEAEAHAHRLDRLGGNARVLRHLIEEISRRELQQEKRHQRDAEQQRDRLQQPPQHVGAHGGVSALAAASRTPARCSRGCGAP